MSDPTDGSPTIQPVSAVQPLPPDTPWWAKMLVENWRDCWRWISTYLIAAAASAPLAYEYLPSIKNYVSDATFHHVEALLVVLIFLGRIAKQKEPQS